MITIGRLMRINAQGIKNGTAYPAALPFHGVDGASHEAVHLDGYQGGTVAVIRDGGEADVKRAWQCWRFRDPGQREPSISIRKMLYGPALQRVTR
jgi:hypothetical protein